MELATLIGSFDIIQYLILHGANIEHKIIGGSTSLHIASFKYLISCGINIDDRDLAINLPLHFCSE